MLRQFAAGYLAGADPKRPLALSGLPPLLVLVGTADVLLSDSKRLAEAAAKAGVDVTLEIGEGLPHVYPIMLGTPRQPRPPGRSGSSCRPGPADQTARRRKPFPAPSPSPGYLTPGELRRGVWPSGRFITFSRLSIGSAA